MGTPWLQPTEGRIRLRRSVFVLLVALTIAFIAWRALTMLQLNGVNALKLAIYVLFVILVIPLALSFWTAAIGFIVQWRGGDSLDLSRSLKTLEPGVEVRPALAAATSETKDAPGQSSTAPEDGHTPPPNQPRTAIVMPVYNEDPSRVFAGIYASYRSLEETGWLSRFDFFVLSDTTNPDT